jgi:thiol-disulfide isomerase/thioredoxin
MEEYKDLKIISLTKDNVDDEHICCALNDKKNEPGMLGKKAWLKAQFDHGYTFKKLGVRGKVFIEYMPAEIAWRPVIAPGFIFIQCIWVSGKFKGHSLGKRLLDECLKDSAESNGVVVVTSSKPFLADKKFFMHYGFEICDTAPPHFELLVKKFRDVPDPQFSKSAKNLNVSVKEGVYIVYTDQCPFNEYYVRLLKEVSANNAIPFQSHKITSPVKMLESPSAYGSFNMFYNGKFKTHVIPTEKQFLKLIYY